MEILSESGHLLDNIGCLGDSLLEGHLSGEWISISQIWEFSLLSDVLLSSSYRNLVDNLRTLLLLAFLDFERNSNGSVMGDS